MASGREGHIACPEDQESGTKGLKYPFPLSGTLFLEIQFLGKSERNLGVLCLMVLVMELLMTANRHQGLRIGLILDSAQKSLAAGQLGSRLDILLVPA